MSFGSFQKERLRAKDRYRRWTGRSSGTSTRPSPLWQDILLVEVRRYVSLLNRTIPRLTVIQLAASSKNSIDFRAVVVFDPAVQRT